MIRVAMDVQWAFDAIIGAKRCALPVGTEGVGLVGRAAAKDGTRGSHQGCGPAKALPIKRAEYMCADR